MLKKTNFGVALKDGTWYKYSIFCFEKDYFSPEEYLEKIEIMPDVEKVWMINQEWINENEVDCP